MSSTTQHTCHCRCSHICSNTQALQRTIKYLQICPNNFIQNTASNTFQHIQNVCMYLWIQYLEYILIPSNTFRTHSKFKHRHKTVKHVFKFRFLTIPPDTFGYLALPLEYLHVPSNFKCCQMFSNALTNLRLLETLFNYSKTVKC